jgi:hypothetical protein
MSGWYKVTMSPDDIAQGRHFTLSEQFYHLFVLFGAPKGAGLFTDVDVMTNAYYFSPAAALIAMPLIANYTGVECAAPSRSSVRVLAAHDAAKDILSPTREVRRRAAEGNC